MGGGMDIDGDVNLSGGMEMGGELATRIKLPSDARVSPLTPTCVDGEIGQRSKIAILDVDDLLVERTPSGLGGSGENAVSLFREKIDMVIGDENIRAVVLRINSPGGGVTASDVMASELQRLKSKRDIPVATCILDVGTGGAYYLACHTDAVFAHPTSLVGGIGVILNVYNLQDTMGQFNVLASTIKSGEMIDAGTPQRPLEDSEMEVLQKIADQFHARFINIVIQRRPLTGTSRETWTDGRVMTGSEAKDLGLVDEVGYIDAALDWARQASGLPSSAPAMLYRRKDQLAFTPLDALGTSTFAPSLIPLSIPGLQRSKMPTFLYLWQAEPTAVP